jgi:4-hydroxybenzoate polyprenyltransferase
MSNKNRDIYGWIDGFSSGPRRGSALTTTREREVDIFQNEIYENSINIPLTYILAGVAIFLPILFASFDGKVSANRIFDFDGATQFFIILPFLTFTALISTTWFLAYRNHIQRVAAIKRKPSVKVFSILSICFGVCAVVNMLCMDVDSFALYWAISLFLIFCGYFCALQVVKRFGDLIHQLRSECQDIQLLEYPFQSQEREFPLGTNYKSLTFDERRLIYDQRVKELASITNIVSGWHISNTVLAFFMIGYCSFTFSTYAMGWERDYIQVMNLIENGLPIKIASLGAPLTYWIEVISLVYFLLVGVLAASLRSRINPTVYGDEVQLCNTTSPLNPNTIAQNDVSNSNDVSSSDSEDKKMDTNQLTKAIALSESGRVPQALASAVLLYFSSGEWLYSVAFGLFLVLSFLINDAFDFVSGKDEICHPERALPSGRLSLTASLVASAIALGLLFLLSFEFSIYQQVSLFSGMVLSVAYSLALKRFYPAFGTIVWVISVAVVFLGVFGQPLDVGTYSIFAVVFYAREILLDIRDADADEKMAMGATINWLGDKNRQYMFSSMLFALGAGLTIILPTLSVAYSGLLLGLSVLLLLKVFTRNEPLTRRVSLLSYAGPFFFIGFV